MYSVETATMTYQCLPETTVYDSDSAYISLITRSCE